MDMMRRIRKRKPSEKGGEGHGESHRPRVDVMRRIRKRKPSEKGGEGHGESHRPPVGIGESQKTRKRRDWGIPIILVTIREKMGNPINPAR